MKYEVVVKQIDDIGSIQVFIDEVNDALSRDWKCQGGLVSVMDWDRVEWWYQAMVKNED